jgi:hypothetical protein
MTDREAQELRNLADGLHVSRPMDWECITPDREHSFWLTEERAKEHAAAFGGIAREMLP